MADPVLPMSLTEEAHAVLSAGKEFTPTFVKALEHASARGWWTKVMKQAAGSTQTYPDYQALGNITSALSASSCFKQASGLSQSSSSSAPVNLLGQTFGAATAYLAWPLLLGQTCLPPFISQPCSHHQWTQPASSPAPHLHKQTHAWLAGVQLRASKEQQVLPQRLMCPKPPACQAGYCNLSICKAAYKPVVWTQSSHASSEYCVGTASSRG